MRQRAPLILSFPALAWLLAVLLLLAAGAARATSTTTITFENLAAGTELRDQYRGLGVRFGAVSDFPVDIGATTDCGAPVVQGTTSKVARVPPCEGVHAAVVAFEHPRKEIRVLAGAGGTSDGPRSVELMAFDGSGRVLERAQANLNSVVSIARGSPDVRYAAVKQVGEQSGLLYLDNLTFDHLGDPLTLSGRNVVATVGVERTDNVAFFTDADPTAVASDYRARIEWGDGQSSDGRISAAGGGYDVFGTHTYAQAGSFTVRTVVEKVNGVSASASSRAMVSAGPDFALEVAPASASVTQGQRAIFRVSVSALAGFSGAVSLSLAGASGSFAPASVTVPGTSTLTVVTSGSTAPATYPLTITGTSGNLVRTATASLVVSRSPVTAKIAGPRSVPSLGRAVLSAKGSVGAARFLWDLDGDRRTDVECGGNSPFLGVRLGRSGSRTVRLTAVAADGARASSTVRLAVLAASAKAKTAGRRLVEVGVCAAREQTFISSARLLCADKVVFGLVEARGCLDEVTRREDVPAAERAVVDHYYAQQGLSRTEQALCEKGDPRCSDFLARSKALQLYVARSPVRINGLTFRPSRGASIVVYPQLQRVVSSYAEIGLGGMTVREAAPVDLDLKSQYLTLGRGARASGRVDLFTADLPKPLPIAGFNVQGQARLSLRRSGERRFTEAAVSVALPKVFSLFGGPAPSGAATLEADNERGLALDALNVRVPEAHLGAIRFTNVSFSYSASGNAEARCPSKWWKATANVFLGSTGNEGGLRLSPPPSQNGIAFCQGRFTSAGGALVFGGPIPRPQLFPGVFLNEINFAVALDPTLVRGGAKISAADLVEVDGVLLAVFPSQAAPYRLSAGDAGSQLAKLAGRTFVTTTFALGGTVVMRVPAVGRIPFANAYFMYAYPDYIAFGGGARFVVPGAALNVGIDGELAVSRALFSTHGFGEVCIAGLACLLRAEAWVTSKGVVVCGSIAGELHPGVGYRWGEAWPTIWLVDGCKPSRYWVQVQSSHLRAGSGQASTSFSVAQGERTKNVKLEGVTGAPDIQVRGADGETVSTAGRDLVVGRTIRVLRQDQGRVTWIGVAGARPGTYTISTLPGSSAIRGLAATRPEPATRIRATVTGKGNRRVLRYVVPTGGNRRVTFVERGAGTFHRIGVATKTRGAIPFTPAPGGSVARRIVALVEIAGRPAPDIALARFRAQPTARPGGIDRLEVRRRGSSLDVSWAARAANATGYAVVVRMRSGLVRTARVSAGRRGVRLSGIPVTQAGAVIVRAVGAFGALGRPASGTFAATGKPPTRLRPFGELGRKR